MIWERREQPNKVTEIINFKWVLNVASKWGLELKLAVLHRVVRGHERAEHFLGVTSWLGDHSGVMVENVG